jgi:hypothetical protein
MSVFVIRAFVKMRETLLGTRVLAKKLAALEKKLPASLTIPPIVKAFTGL